MMRIVALLCLVLTGCQLAPCKLEPQISYTPSSGRITSLPSPFPPLSQEERSCAWAQELCMGGQFVKDWDLYRAIFCYKRALFLLPQEEFERRQQVEYDLILCYYLGHKYQEVVNLFEESSLAQATPCFPAFDNLLILLYDSYQQVGNVEKGEWVMSVIKKYSEETAEDLSLYWDLQSGDIEQAEAKVAVRPDRERFDDTLCLYDLNKKSPKKARLLNAILPGAGYAYVGQKKTALTSFLINTLFTYATYQFFHRGYPAAGIITGSLELGWYVGGINGAGIEAQEFNNRLYEGVVRKTLLEERCFPVLMFQTSF